MIGVISTVEAKTMVYDVSDLLAGPPDFPSAQPAWRVPNGDATRGRGLHLMRAFCPELEVVRDAHGTEVRLARDFNLVRVERADAP